MAAILERHRVAVTLVFSLEDAFARDRLGDGARRRPLEPLRFWLRERTTGGPVETFTPPRELAVTRNASGYHLFFGRERLGSQSTVALDMTGGDYTIEITSPGRVYQTVRATFTLPMPNPNIVDASSPDPDLRDPMRPYTVDLQPGHAYPFPDSYPFRPESTSGPCAAIAPGGGATLLRGSLHAVDGSGIAGALVEVPGASNVFETSDSGDWVLWFPETHPSGLVTVRVTLPAAPPVNVAAVCVVNGRETSLHETSLRGWVRRQGVGIAGAEIRVSGRLATSRSAGDGSWTYFFGLGQPDETVAVTAVLPSGESVTRPGIGVKRRGAVVVPPLTFV